MNTSLDVRPHRMKNNSRIINYGTFHWSTFQLQTGTVKLFGAILESKGKTQFDLKKFWHSNIFKISN